MIKEKALVAFSFCFLYNVCMSLLFTKEEFFNEK